MASQRHAADDGDADVDDADVDDDADNAVIDSGFEYFIFLHGSFTFFFIALYCFGYSIIH